MNEEEFMRAAGIRGPATYFDPGFRPSPEDEANRWRTHANMLEQSIARLQERPLSIGVVIGEDAGKLILRDGSNVVSLKPPHGLDVAPGDSVYITGDGAILGRVDSPARFGRTYEVKRLDGDRWAEVADHDGSIQYVSHSKRAIKVGDRVLLDGCASVVTHVMPALPTALVYADDTGVEWDDIGGQSEAKRALIAAIEGPYKHAAIYKKYGKRPTRGILLYGPPGTGKTMFAKAVATSLAKMHGASAKAGGFIYVKGPEVLNKFVGASEAGVRGIFATARAFKAKSGYPAVICIDEADALLGKRGVDIVEGMEKTVVPQFLAEMDGLDDTGALVLLLTNRPEALDPACVRDGRVDRKVRVGRPTQAEAADIIDIALDYRPKSGESLGVMAADLIWSHKPEVLMVRTKGGKGDRRIGLDAFVSGAMLVGIVERATDLAIAREIEATCGYEGITEADMRAAVRQARAELEGLDHSSVAFEVLGNAMADVVRIEPIGVP